MNSAMEHDFQGQGRSPKPSINIVFQTDNDHAWMTGIALRSLVDAYSRSPNSQVYRLRIFFVSHDLNEANQQFLHRVCATEAVDMETEIIDCPLKAVNPNDRRIELLTARLRLPQILSHLDRILFLDSDILVLDDISKLWEINLGGHWLGAAACLNTSDDVALRNYNHEFKIKFKQVIDPINGGVLIMDLRKMRELDATTAMLVWLQANRDAIYNLDQEAISIYCGGQFTVLSPEWNFRLFAEPYWTSSWPGYRAYVKLKPSIVHFQNPLRPHLLRGQLPYFSEWVEYYDKVLQRKLQGARPIPYFIFVYFEFYFVISLLALGIASFRWRTFLTGAFLCPYIIVKYLQYIRSPEQYRFRIWKYFSKSEPSGKRKKQPA